jgi:proteasome assembly chaperone (PAC2) family protein
MPLFSTGQARRNPALIAGQLISSAVEKLSRDHLIDKTDPDLRMALFSAYTEDDVKLLQQIFEALVADEALRPVTKSNRVT